MELIVFNQSYSPLGIKQIALVKKVFSVSNHYLDYCFYLTVK